MEHPELEPLGKKIVQRCGNVPLAVIIVGSLLRHREKGERIWSDFLDKELSDSLSKSDDKNSESMKNVLMLSYNDLLPKLKLCFAYCSLFPKDYTFDKDVLVRLWLAQGFLLSSVDDERSLEKRGEEYFFHLVERCFFQEVKKKRNDYSSFYEVDENVRYGHTAKMHDLLHDVAIDVAKADCVFLDKVSMVNNGEKENLRHISISCDLDSSFDYCSLVSDPKTVRTLIIHHGKQFSKDPLNKSMERFRMIRTLHLPQLGIDNIPECIGELIHLRYLDLSQNHKLKQLPKSICKLHHLMVLVLVNCVLLEDLPPNLEKLVSLRQLCIHGCKSLGSIPAGLIGLTSLVKLDRLVVHRQEGGLRYLQGLDNLRGILTIELPVDGWSDAITDAGKANMSKKPKLNGMVIEWNGAYHPQKMPRDEARAVLDALQPHRNLEYLKIENYGGDMLSSWFNTLKNVVELHLSCCDVEYLEDEIRGDSYFPSLKILILVSLLNLKGWWRQEVVEEAKWPRLPKVSNVRIWSCPELKGRMPVFDEFEDLLLEGVDMELVTWLLIGENNKLKTLRLHSIDGLMSLPEGWLRHLTGLQNLSVEDCDNLEWVSCRGLAHLTSLKYLKLGCCEIIDVGDDSEVETTEEGMPWKALKGLESLKVAASEEHLIDGLQYLTPLKCLEIFDSKGEQGGDEEMESSVESSLNALRNLRILVIGFDNRTVGLPKVIQYLPSLEILIVEKCEGLYLDWKSLFSMKLNSLTFSSVKRVINVEDMVMEKQSQLGSLSIYNGEAEWVDDVPWNYLASLKYLSIDGVKGMKKLADGIQHLTSLQQLCLGRCEEVRSLPNWIPKLTSLTTLEISDCSAELKRRCEEEMGEDWSLIRHLPYVLIKERVVYRWEEDVTDVPMDEDVIGEMRDEEEGEGSVKKRWCGLPFSFHG